MKYYLIEGKTRIVQTHADREDFNGFPDTWLAVLQNIREKFWVHADLEKELEAYNDGDEVPGNKFLRITCALPLSMDEKFTYN